MKPTATERDAPKPSLHANKETGSHDDSRRPFPEENRNQADGLAKVQELLFGAQFREHAQRIAHLEESLTRVASEWKQELNTAQIKSEHEGRAQSSAGLLHDLNELGKTVSASTAQLHQQASTESRELRQQMADQQQALLAEMHQKNKELSNVMESALRELRREKVTRAALAELFTKSAQSLGEDLAQTRGK
jgi:hypothetical protein